MDMLHEQRRKLGRSMNIASLVAILMSGLVMYKLSSARAEAASRFTESQETCKTRLTALGGEVTDAPGRIVWMKKDLIEAPARLGEASVAAVMCPGWKLAAACMGEQCPETDAMRIVLQPINSEDSE
jgi:hypothetical protein